jgi:hypothetical protein
MAAPETVTSRVRSKIHAVVEELLLGKFLSRQGQLKNGHRGGVVGNDQRGRRARRQLPQLGLTNRGDLRDRLLDIGVRLEEHLHHRNPVQRLRFAVLDVVHRSGQHPLVQGHDPAERSCAFKPA